ncbi:hypothetical protein QBK99_08150 [Corticibacterium sp. UT-5YL-CI-8]|nr:hypothetical protein [Tianweitania sp. UT-5YL-CI-8]
MIINEKAAAHCSAQAADISKTLSDKTIASKEEIQAFLQLLAETGGIHLVALPSAEGRNFGVDVGAAADWIAARPSVNMHYTLNLVGADYRGSKPKGSEITAIRACHVDIDGPKDGSPWDKSAAYSKLVHGGASVIIDSGHGWHALWLLTTPDVDTERAERVNRALLARYGGDVGTHNRDRLLRVAGTLNHKRAPVVPCRDRSLPLLPGMSKPRYSLDELEQLFGVAVSTAPVSHTLMSPEDRELIDTASRSGSADVDMGGGRIFHGSTASFSDLWTGNASVLGRCFPAEGRPFDQSRADEVLLFHLARLTGCETERMERLFTQSALGVREKWRGRVDYRERSIRKAVEGVSATPAVPLLPVGKAVIQITVDAHQMANDVEKALMARGVPFYTRGNRVRELAGADLIEVSPERMRDLMAKHVKFEKLVEDKRNLGWKKIEVAAPLEVARTILSRVGDWKFRPVNGVLSVPTMRKDGSIIDTVGYDDATGLIVVQNVPMPPIPDRPTMEQAQIALKMIGDLFAETPFVDDASRAVAISAVLTGVLRGSMDRAPLHAFTAPMSGTGKTFACDVTAAILYGEPSMRSIAMGSGKEEFEKRLSGTLLAGRTTVLVDNVNRPIGGEFLCQAIERPEVEVRPLGRSDIRIIQNTHTIYATGNNLRVDDDNVRRTIRARLDAKNEQPWTRKFAGDPIATVLANRGAYLAAAFTISRAYMAAGEPIVAGPFGSFQMWSRRVRSPLVWLGMTDPVLTQDDLRNDDDSEEVLAAVIASWPVLSKLRVKEMMVAPAKSTKMVTDQFQEALSMIPIPPHARDRDIVIGQWLKANVGRIVNGRKIVSERNAHHKANVYWVE